MTPLYDQLWRFQLKPKTTSAACYLTCWPYGVSLLYSASLNPYNKPHPGLQCYNVTMFQCNNMTMLLCYNITMLPCYNVTQIHEVNCCKFQIMFVRPSYFSIYIIISQIPRMLINPKPQLSMFPASESGNTHSSLPDKRMIFHLHQSVTATLGGWWNLAWHVNTLCR